MLKVLFVNEEDLLEIIYSNKIFVDPEAPTDIIIVSISNPIRLRIRFVDTEEVDNFMEVLFEGDKINLAEISKTSPEMTITVEENDFYEQFGFNPDEYEDLDGDYEE